MECLEGILVMHGKYCRAFQGRAKCEKGRDQGGSGWNKGGKMKNCIVCCLLIKSCADFH